MLSYLIYHNVIKEKILFGKQRHRFFPFLFLFIILGFVSFSLASATVLYKWTDKKGQVHITDYPPPADEEAEEESIEELTEEKRTVPQSAPQKEEFKNTPSQQPETPSVQEEIERILKKEFEQLQKKKSDQKPEAVPQRRLPSMPKQQPAIPPQTKIPSATGLMFLMMGTGMMIFLVALALLMYFYFSLTSYMICKKLGISYAWLVWVPVPVANFIPIVKASGKPLWWILILFAPSFLGLLGANAIVGVLSLVMGLAAIVLVVIIWMGITENLGLNKWAGLLILVPVVQLVFVGYLAYKSESAEKQIDTKKPTLIAAAVFIIIVIAISALFYLTVPPLLRESFRAPQMTFRAPSSTSAPIKRPPSEDQTYRPEKVVSLTESEYTKLLNSKRVSFPSGAQVSIGPAAIKMDQFWSSKNSPHLWLKVKMLSIPNLTIASRPVKLVINHIWDKNGKDLYNGNNQFEKEFFHNLNLIKSPDGITAIRDVYLKPGATQESIKTVEGKLIIKLPIQIKSLSFNTTDKDKEQAYKGVRVRLREIGPDYVVISYQGPPEHFLSMIGYNAKGEALKKAGSSRMRLGSGTIEIRQQFSGRVRRVDVIVASKIQEVEYTFSISK